VPGILVPKTKFGHFSSSYTLDNVGNVFDVFLFISTLISCVPFPQVVQKHTLGVIFTQLTVFSRFKPSMFHSSDLHPSPPLSSPAFSAPPPLQSSSYAVH